jgi:hypothetical protein
MPTFNFDPCVYPSINWIQGLSIVFGPLVLLGVPLVMCCCSVRSARRVNELYCAEELKEIDALSRIQSEAAVKERESKYQVRRVSRGARARALTVLCCVRRPCSSTSRTSTSTCARTRSSTTTCTSTTASRFFTTACWTLPRAPACSSSRCICRWTGCRCCTRTSRCWCSAGSACTSCSRSSCARTTTGSTTCSCACTTSARRSSRCLSSLSPTYAAPSVVHASVLTPACARVHAGRRRRLGGEHAALRVPRCRRWCASAAAHLHADQGRDRVAHPQGTCSARRLSRRE